MSATRSDAVHPPPKIEAIENRKDAAELVNQALRRQQEDVQVARVYRVLSAGDSKAGCEVIEFVAKGQPERAFTAYVSRDGDDAFVSLGAGW